MADGVKISLLPGASTPSDSDVVSGVQSGVTKKFSFSSIYAWLMSRLVPEDIGAVPDTRTVNGKSLDSDIALTASDVGARPDTWFPTAAQVGARPDTWTPSAQDVGAAPAKSVLRFTSVAVSAGASQQIISISNADITADHVLARIEWTNPSYITEGYTWTTGAGSFTLSGTCTAATTANVVLIRKGN